MWSSESVMGIFCRRFGSSGPAKSTITKLGDGYFMNVLYLLEVGDSLEVLRAVTDATEDYLEIPAGTRCCFNGYDKDGDICIGMPTRIASRSETTVFF